MTKPRKWHVRPAKTQISLGIRPVWSESPLSAWRKLGSLATQWAHSEDSDQTGRMLKLFWVFAGRTVILLILSWGGSIINGWVSFCVTDEKIMNGLLCFPEHFTFSTQTKLRDGIITWTAPSEFGTYRICEQRRFRRACASAQSRQNLRCSLIQALSQEEPSDRKPHPWPLWMAGHAQLKLVMTECSKTQIRLTGLTCCRLI